MNMYTDFKKIALIAYLVKQLKKLRRQIGKTVIHKMFYLLSKKSDIQIENDFILYHYGPYSFKLEQDLMMSKWLNVVNITWNQETGYKITLSDNAEKLISLLSDHEKSELDNIASIFGVFTAKELSLLATIVYIKDMLENKGLKVEEKDLIEIVRKVKPTFSEEEIRKKISYLKEKFYIKRANN